MSVAVPELGPIVEIEGYEAIRAALYNPDLSRTFDRRTFAEGNPGDGTVSTAHGALHRARRRVENTQFRSEMLIKYERVIFPGVLERIYERLIRPGPVDLAQIAPLLSVGIAARRAGLDFEEDSIEDLRVLVDHVDAFSHGLGPGILEVPDPDAARARVLAALADFERDFVRPAWERRADLLARRASGEDSVEVPRDILTTLLVHRDDPELELADDSRIVREVATFLQGGTHSSAQTLLNTLEFVFQADDRKPSIRTRILDDRLYAARCIHETLRLRPITPRVKRRAEAETTVGGRTVPRDALVVLDVVEANRDPSVFGPDAADFNPDRPLPANIPRWGLSFSVGPHQCPGRSSAGGLPVPPDFVPRPDHLYGTVSLMLQESVKRGVRPDPDRVPARDTRSERYFFWESFPVLFPAA